MEERDHSDIDNFTKILFAHESVGCHDIDKLTTFSDLICIMDTSEYKPTRYWFIDTAADYIGPMIIRIMAPIPRLS